MSSQGGAVVAQDVVQRALVVPPAMVELLDEEAAGQSALVPARERAGPAGGHGDGPRRHDAPADLLAAPRLDDRDRAGQDATGAEHDAVPDASAVGHDAAAADQALVADHDRG